MPTPIEEKMDEIGRAVHDFQAKNDEALAELKTKGATDAVLTEHVDRINTAITELTDEKAAMKTEIEGLKALKTARNDDESPDVTAYESAYFGTKGAGQPFGRGGYIRKGYDDGLGELQHKALQVGVDADGGFSIPEKLDRSIFELMRADGVMRSLCNVVQVGGENYRRLVNLQGATSGWVGETAARTETATPTFAELTPFMGEIYAFPFATQRMLDDAFFDVEAFLAEQVALEFGEQEETAFFSGDGTDKPKGFLAYTQAETADGVRAFGSIQKKDTGIAGGFKVTSATVNPADDLLDLVYMMKGKLRKNASWMMHNTTIQEVRKFKDNDGAYIWQRGIKEGEPNTVLGYAVHDAEDMPVIADTNVAVAFGNWKRAYSIVDRMGTRILRDPYTAKPKVGFYTTKRVGGFLVDSEAIKLLITQL